MMPSTNQMQDYTKVGNGVAVLLPQRLPMLRRCQSFERQLHHNRAVTKTGKKQILQSETY